MRLLRSSRISLTMPISTTPGMTPSWSHSMFPSTAWRGTLTLTETRRLSSLRVTLYSAVLSCLSLVDSSCSFCFAVFVVVLCSFDTYKMSFTPPLLLRALFCSWNSETQKLKKNIQKNIVFEWMHLHSFSFLTMNSLFLIVLLSILSLSYGYLIVVGEVGYTDARILYSPQFLVLDDLL